MIKVLKTIDGTAVKFHLIDDTTIVHRDDGPAVEASNGEVRWYLNNRRYTTKEEWFEVLTEEQRLKALYSEHFIRG